MGSFIGKTYNTGIGTVAGISTIGCCNTTNGMNNVYIGYSAGAGGAGTIYWPFDNFNIKEIFNNFETIKSIKYKNNHIDYNFLQDLIIERKKLSKKYRECEKDFDIFEIRKKKVLKKLEINYKKIKKELSYFLQTKINNVIEIQYEPIHYSNAYDNCTILLKNGVIHSINDAAVKLQDRSSGDLTYFYLVDGKQYPHVDWIKHPTKILQERRLKIKKLFN
jgi:hypothetical protein